MAAFVWVSLKWSIEAEISYFMNDIFKFNSLISSRQGDRINLIILDRMKAHRFHSKPCFRKSKILSIQLVAESRVYGGDAVFSFGQET